MCVCVYIYMYISMTPLAPLQVPSGTSIITQGEKGNHFYVVDSGELVAYVQSDPEKPQAQVRRLYEDIYIYVCFYLYV